MKKNHNLQPINYMEKENLKSVQGFLRRNGDPGRFVGFYSLNPHYTHKDSGVTDWTGFPGSGKTYFLLEVLFRLSDKEGMRHMLYVPDLGTYNDIISKLIKMRTGKDFHDRYINKISPDELQEHLPWIIHHFVVLRRTDIRKPITAVEFWEYVCDYEDEGGIVQTGVIDSWKNMFKNFKDYGREDLYLDYVLSYRNELAEEYKKHFHTIAHATKTEFDEGNVVSGKKKRRVPDAYDIKGGGSWFANGKNIITVDFPDKNSFGVDLYISKTKPEDVGSIGSVIGSIYLDKQKGRYYETINGRKRYSMDEQGILLPEPRTIVTSQNWVDRDLKDEEEMLF